MARTYTRHLNNGDIEPHTHAQDHWTYCVQGRVSVGLDDDLHEMNSKTPRLMVKAEHMHSVKALEPNSIVVCDFREVRHGAD